MILIIISQIFTIKLQIAIANTANHTSSKIKIVV